MHIHLGLFLQWSGEHGSPLAVSKPLHFPFQGHKTAAPIQRLVAATQ